MKRYEHGVSPPPEKVTIDADYVVEWYVENDAVKYRQFTVDGPPTGAFRHKSGDKMPTREISHGVVCVVLEVPLPLMEKVTTQLRASRKIRGAAPYLQTAAAAAGREGAMLERMAKLEIENKKLRALALDNARILDQYDERIIQAEKELDEPLVGRLKPAYPTSVPHSRKGFGRAWVMDTNNQLDSIEVQATAELNKIRSVLDEKRADVAAQLLAKMPDGDW